MSDKKVRPVFAGIHISGPNVHKTSVVIATGGFDERGLRVTRVYDKIGSYAGLFSDERLAEILRMEGPFAEVVVDCPLSEPPCVSCTRPTCPGVVQCDDVAVAYMLAMADKIKERNPKKRRRTLNPQTQRLWDVIRLARGDHEHLEPSYSANMSPLVVRARTLQRRLRAMTPVIELKETSVHFALKRLAIELGFSSLMHLEYKNFELGAERRDETLTELVKRGWFLELEPELRQCFVESVENFQALIGVLVGAMLSEGRCEMEPRPYIDGESWVYIPQFE